MMTVVDPPESNSEQTEMPVHDETKKRRRLLLLLFGLLILLCFVSSLFVRYLMEPEPLPDLLPLPIDVSYPPHYLFSIYGVEKPIGVAASPESDRIYAVETGGERLVKMFDRDGNLLGSFSPPHTHSGERSPVYIATDSSGRLYVTDRLQDAIFVYDSVGKYLDSILASDLTLSEYISKHTGDLEPDNSTFAYDVFEQIVSYQTVGDEARTFPAPDARAWAPLGVRIMDDDTMLLTEVVEKHHSFRIIPGDVLMNTSWQDFNSPELSFGTYGQGNGEFLFPNSAVVDSKDWTYVSDGNNGRISVWDEQNHFLFNFGQGSGEGAVSLPRGIFIDEHDRLYIVDAVGQNVKVYDVSGQNPEFLFTFGDWGLSDGQFNYPNDITLDASGRIYVADRENDRIQVWSY